MDTGSTSTVNLIESLTNTLFLLYQSFKAHLPQTHNQLRTSSNARNNAIVQDVVVQDARGRYNANNHGRSFQRNNARGNVVAGNAGAENSVNNFDDDVYDGVQYDAFDSVLMRLTHKQDHVMVNLSSEDPIYDEAGPSYDSNTPFEVQDHDTFVDHMDEYHEVHEMQSDVQHNYVVDSDADYTSDSNIIPYDQYVEDNEEHVVQSDVSSVRNDALISILDEMHEQGVQSMSANKQVKVVNDTLTSELARYEELVGVYEQRAKFELTDREQKIDEQMRIIISDRNRKETSLKSELHSAQLQLRSTLNHHKIMREEAIILKKDFKQKEDKFLEEFLDIKRLKEKVEDRLYKQDQSVQTVHMILDLEEVKQHYKELFESIQITRASTNEKTSSLLTQIEDLKAQLEGNLKVAARSSVKNKQFLLLGMYAIDVRTNLSSPFSTIARSSLSKDVVNQISYKPHILNCHKASAGLSLGPFLKEEKVVKWIKSRSARDRDVKKRDEQYPSLLGVVTRLEMEHLSWSTEVAGKRILSSAF
ncbi:hypothetical protein Tco_0891747 [Tanacetum coccineum]|uniref:Uncharacterized protein n=1 Tax=Tanacetum coccineum TaxID=301880 RepID=A0ABQ5C3U7_9ASTR